MRNYKKKKTKKIRRSLRILDSLTPGRKLKLIKLKKKIERGDYSTRRYLLDVFDEILNDAKRLPPDNAEQ